jgi:acyl CoA:acetate/3-ketoacid CoA transferase alpha subunit/acyl CoA:acetate/3-ketoacid CoA transferase beta subunit
MSPGALRRLVDRVDDGDTVALGGKTLHRAPMALVRELVRRGHEDLTLVGLACSMDVDLPCGTGTASGVHYGYVGFEALGLAPNYRRAFESGRLTAREGTCYTVATMLRGAAQGVDSLPVAGLAGSDLPAVNDALETATDPFTGTDRAVVRAVTPDVALVHAAEADPTGNLRLGGADLTERLCADAAGTVLATAERVVDAGTFADRPEEVDVPGFLVDAVAEVPFGAHPCACPGVYDYDAASIGRYLDRSREGDLAAYVEGTLGPDEATYRERAVAGREDAFAWSDGDGDVGSDGADDASPVAPDADPAPDVEATAAEAMAVALLRRLSRVDNAFQGFASPLPTVALRAAHETEGTTHLSASGAVNGRPARTPLSTESARLLDGATARFTSPESFDLAARGGVDVMFVGGAQFDRAGRLNGTVAGSWDDPTVKFGGAGGSGSLLPLVEHAWGWRTEHSTRTLPGEVDFVTAVGNLDYLVTPLCAFEPVDGELAVTALHPGVDRATVRERTGWEPTFADSVRTPPPTDAELALLDRVDPERVRRSGFTDLDPLSAV